jgi:Ser/Thr protein kinase RdoA (MazF antagonist)
MKGATMIAVWISKPRYRKSGVTVRTANEDNGGFRTKPAAIVQRLGGRWVHRDGGYALSTARAKHLMRVLGRMKIAYENTAHPDYDVRRSANMPVPGFYPKQVA